MKSCTFVHNGSIKQYNGSISQLKNSISKEEWQAIINDTVNTYIYLGYLRDRLFKELNEKWSEEESKIYSELDKFLKSAKKKDPTTYDSVDRLAIHNHYNQMMATAIGSIRKIVSDHK